MARKKKKMKTSHNRLLRVGTHRKGPRRWTLGQPLPDRAHNIFYEAPVASTPGHGVFALPETDGAMTGSHVADPLPPSPPPNIMLSPVRTYFLAKHGLSGLVRVTPCRCRVHGGVSGLMLHFASGRREVIGNVRLDYLDDDKSLPVGGSDKLYLGFRFLQKPRTYYVATISASPLPEKDYLDVFELSDDGVLEWLWEDSSSLVIYKGRVSPWLTSQ